MPDEEASRSARPSLAAGLDRPPCTVHDVALLDLDGVVYVGADAVPGVPGSLAAVRKAGMRLGFVTNNAARHPEEVAEHLTRLGVPADASDVITSSQAAATAVVALLGPGQPVLAVGGPGVAAALVAAGLVVVTGAAEAPKAVVQGYGTDIGWTDLAEAVVAVRGGARHVATNTDATIPSPRGPLPGNGAMVGVVSAVTGQQPLVTGKPDPAMHAECVRRTGATRPLVVGDRLDTDIEGARRAGAASLLVFTGVTDPAALLAAGPLHRPDLIAVDTAGLLVPHPAVSEEATGHRCRGWSVAAANGEDALVLAAPDMDSNARDSNPRDRDEEDPDEEDPDEENGDAGDGLDGLRALCVAHWSRHPENAVPVRALAADERAAEALARWGLRADVR